MAAFLTVTQGHDGFLLLLDGVLGSAVLIIPVPLSSYIKIVALHRSLIYKPRVARVIL